MGPNEGRTPLPSRIAPLGHGGQITAGSQPCHGDRTTGEPIVGRPRSRDGTEIRERDGARASDSALTRRWFAFCHAKGSPTASSWADPCSASRLWHGAWFSSRPRSNLGSHEWADALRALVW